MEVVGDGYHNLIHYIDLYSMLLSKTRGLFIVDYKMELCLLYNTFPKMRTSDPEPHAVCHYMIHLALI